MRVAVIGVGRLGKEHARIWSALPGVSLVGVLDTDAARAAEIAHLHGTRALTSLDEVLREADAASVVTPTTHHFEVASRCIEAGLHVLVEKPMTHTLEEANALVDLAARRGRVLQVGHIERFNPALEAARRYIGAPRFIDCDRISPFSFRSGDIGVVMDLMIHDLDIILSLVRSEVTRVDAIGVNVMGPTEDLAHVRLEFANGCVANITASRLALKKLRKFRIFQPDAYISIDFSERNALLITKRPGFEQGKLDVATLDLTGVTDLQSLLFEKFLDAQFIPMDEYEPLKRELESFRDAVVNGAPVPVTGEEGRAAIAVARRIVEEIRRRLAEETGRSSAVPQP